MIKFFRKIRLDALSRKRFPKYFTYAIGEIFLVVIGILIALAISNWNNNRQQNNTINFYLEKLLEEVTQQITITEEHIKRNEGLVQKQTKTLKILASKNESAIPELREIIGATATVWTNEYSFDTFNEFKQQGLLSQVKNQKLKQLLKDLESILTQVKSYDNYLDDQYNTLIEPYFAKHINYAQNALPAYRQGLVSGGPKTDYKALFDSIELWNVTSLKLETTNGNLYALNKMLETLKALKLNLEKEISND
ncbi:hypothetical protein LX97_03158 [Nonlabens dokdonensis]|jgi:hypothetical protein|uniref:Uncharacterized protein n=2 Tax=Nonlabens dokdonensis TaxID=328515 RepID=L7WCU9_NONDD|nr:hypothetical protein [Nonlabens dokdonensis]AGC78072.1 hypothetical protein DDD_2945 [Nonlabens dokdonensis DSW-6]PZX37136.1 hypothetical protein LX97_03158 [Nonlabens dokdonensis]